MANLPLIDAAALLASDAYKRRDWSTQVAILEAACRGPGFFYLANYGVSRDQERTLFELTQRFFALPLEAKLKIENTRSPHFRGYTRVGQERRENAPDWREQLYIGPEKPAAARDPGAPLYLRLRGPNQWPDELPELAPALSAWITALDRVAIALTRALAVALGQRPDAFDSTFLPEPDTHAKIIRYPGTHGSMEQGVGAHKDYGFLSLVLQDSRGGLEVDDLQGGFIEAIPIPGTLVANLGEMFEVATAGYFRATVHRVRSPRAPAQRYSLAHFFNPRLEAVLGELPLPAELLARRPPASAAPDNPIYNEFGRGALRGWLKSHPEIARRHYPELTPRS